MPSLAMAPSHTATQAAREKVLVLDFGSQYAQLIARRVREQNVYCEIVRHNLTAERIQEIAPIGIILSGGPSSVYAENAPKCDHAIFNLGIPVLGICYGMQIACESLGGKIANTPLREYGRTTCQISPDSELFADVPGKTIVWMSHGDQVSSVSDDFLPLATTDTCRFAAVKHHKLPVYGLQFHPEVTHTPAGKTVLAQLPTNGLQSRRHVEAGRFRRRNDRENSRARRIGPRDLRPLGWR